MREGNGEAPRQGVVGSVVDERGFRVVHDTAVSAGAGTRYAAISVAGAP